MHSWAMKVLSTIAGLIFGWAITNWAINQTDITPVHKSWLGFAIVASVFAVMWAITSVLIATPLMAWATSGRK